MNHPSILTSEAPSLSAWKKALLKAKEAGETNRSPSFNPEEPLPSYNSNSIGAWKKPLIAHAAEAQLAALGCTVPEPLAGHPATSTALLQGSSSPDAHIAFQSTPSGPANSGGPGALDMGGCRQVEDLGPLSSPPPALGWGGQAIHDDSSYRVPWFGRSHHSKTPRTGKDDGKGQDVVAYALRSKSASNADAISADDLLALIQKLPRQEPLPDRVFRALRFLDSRALALLLKDLGRLGMDRRAAELFEHIRTHDDRHGLRPLCDVYTCTAMVSMCIHQLDVDRAMELVEDMRQRGIEPNVHTYTALMNVCIKCGRLPLALEVYNSMRSLNCSPNVVTYNALVDVYGKLGLWEKAVQVLVSMKKEGVQPVLRTYNTLLIACNLCDQPRESLAVCSRLLYDGFTPNSTTYNALISAHGKLGQLDKALGIYHKMAHLNMERSVITYCSVISACEKAGQWQAALGVFAEMQRDGCAPNTVTFNSLITACAQGSQWEKASEVFEHMHSQGCTPDVVTYTALISALERGGQWQKALQAFNRMCKQGCKPDVIVFNAIIDTLWQTGVAVAQRKALQLFSFAVQQGHFRRESVMSNAKHADLNLHAMTAGIAMLSLVTWLQEIQYAVTELGPQALPSSMMIITDMGCSSKEQGNSIVKDAVSSMMSFWQAPFKPVQSPQFPAALEASGAHVAQWVLDNSVEALLAALLPVSAAEGLGVEEAMAGFEQQVSRDCSGAFSAVQMFESTHGLVLDDMCDGYVQERSSLVSELLLVGGKMGLRDEVVHDAVLLMDRVASEAKQIPDEMLPLMGLAAVSVTSKDGSSSSDASSLHQLAGVPPAAIAGMEWHIRLLLRGDMSAISTMRCLKLYLERLGLRRLDPPSIYGLAGFAVMMSVEALYELPLLNCRPSVVAAALLYAERRLRGCVPFWPSTLAKLTGYDDMSSPELLVAVRAAQKIGRKSIYSQIYRAQMVQLSSSAAEGATGGAGAVGAARGSGGSGAVVSTKSLSPTAAAFTPAQARAVGTGHLDTALSAAATAAAAAPQAFTLPTGPSVTALTSAAHADQEQQHAPLSGRQVLPSLDLLTLAMQTLAQQDSPMSPAACSADPQVPWPATASSSSSPGASADMPSPSSIDWAFQPLVAASAQQQTLWS